MFITRLSISTAHAHNFVSREVTKAQTWREVERAEVLLSVLIRRLIDDRWDGRELPLAGWVCLRVHH